MEIWIDCSKTGTYDTNTYDVANKFNWTKGPKRVHVWNKHTGLHGQWIDTWKPKEDTKEMALFVEDDIDISAYAWRWIKAAREEYGRMPQVAGYSLKDDNTYQVAKIVQKDAAFMRRHSLPWGFAPVPSKWRQFQKWYYTKIDDYSFMPWIKGDALHNGWFRVSEAHAKGKNFRMNNIWTQWFYHFMNKNKLLSVFCNTRRQTGKKRQGLEFNRFEKGLHFHRAKGRVDKNGRRTVTEWNEVFVQFPEVVKVVNYNRGLYKTFNMTEIKNKYPK